MDVKGRLVQLSNGMQIDEDTLGVIERIQNYDPNLVVKYLDPDRLDAVWDAPYAIYEKCSDGMERLVFTVWELDMRVMERIYAADNTKRNVLEFIDKNNNAVRTENLRRFAEERDEMKDLVTHIAANNKTTYTFKTDKKLVTIDNSPNSAYKTKDLD